MDCRPQDQTEILCCPVLVPWQAPKLLLPDQGASPRWCPLAEGPVPQGRRKAVFRLRHPAGLQRSLQARRWEALTRLWLTLPDQDGMPGRALQPAGPVQRKGLWRLRHLEGHGPPRCHCSLPTPVQHLLH